MNEDVAKIVGMETLTDRAIAADFLEVSKVGIKKYANALSETVSPKLRETLERQLDYTISVHEHITSYMMEMGYYYPYNPAEQLKVDMETSKKVLQIHRTKYTDSPLDEYRPYEDR